MNASALPQRPVRAVILHVVNILGALLVPYAVSFLIPRFTGIYHDMLGAQPLPPSTALVLRLQPLWALLAVAFVLVALYFVWRDRLQGPPASTSILLLILEGVLIGLIFIPLLLPLITIVHQMAPPAAP